ncbi:uncharacterized protein LOC124946091 [Impatiens glandulifera]|uniref:uncharacterized protein LOC124946091 n=1 Tax=Impatiens glandulifera TaxID=253017 RepID=UPI001FB13CB7|nr:uncharacterized protein LOC124946091 [Impatiens glandulifera]
MAASSNGVGAQFDLWMRTKVALSLSQNNQISQWNKSKKICFPVKCRREVCSTKFCRSDSLVSIRRNAGSEKSEDWRARIQAASPSSFASPHFRPRFQTPLSNNSFSGFSIIPDNPVNPFPNPRFQSVFADHGSSFTSYEFGIPFTSNDVPTNNLISTSTLTYEEDPHEDCDFSDAVLQYINQILMKEDMEEKTCMLQESLDLQAAEKSFYDVIGKKYPPSPQIDRANNGVIDGCFLDSPISHLQLSDLYGGNQSVWQFNKGVEEANKFLPKSSELLINFAANKTPVKKAAVDIVRDLTGSEEGLLSLSAYSNTALASLASLMSEKKEVSEPAVEALINLSQNSDLSAKMVSMGMIKTVMDILYKPDACITRLLVMLLVNLTRIDTGIAALLQVDDEKMHGLYVMKLVRSFCISTEKNGDPFEHVGSILVNISQWEARKKLLVDPKRGLLKQITRQFDSTNLLRKKGVSRTIRNCCFEADSQIQNLLLISEFLWPTLLLPVAGNKIYSEEDTSKMPRELGIVLSIEREPVDDPLSCASSGMFLNLSAVMLRLCEPFLDTNMSKRDKIDPGYAFYSSRLELKKLTAIHASSEEVTEWLNKKNSVQDAGGEHRAGWSSVFLLLCCVSLNFC